MPKKDFDRLMSQGDLSAALDLPDQAVASYTEALKSRGASREQRGRAHARLAQLYHRLYVGAEDAGKLKQLEVSFREHLQGAMTDLTLGKPADPELNAKLAAIRDRFEVARRRRQDATKVTRLKPPAK